MSNGTAEAGALLLPGVDGANPLGFLTALGVLRILTSAWLKNNVRVRWRRHDAAWRPEIHAGCVIAEGELVATLDAELKRRKRLLLKQCLRGHEGFELEKNLKLSPEVFRERAQRGAAGIGRLWTDMAAALATDAVVDQKSGNVETSSLQMVNGGKQQDFLKIITTVIMACRKEHIRNTLFQEWQRADPMVNLSPRWDPADDRRYALRWDNPSEQGTRKSGSQLGANRLAIEALPLFPLCAVAGRSRQVAFTRKGREERFRWPIWVHGCSLDTVRSLLTLQELDGDLNDISRRRRLRSLGVSAVFCSVRFAVDKYQTTSFSTAEAM